MIKTNTEKQLDKTDKEIIKQLQTTQNIQNTLQPRHDKHHTNT